MLILAIAQQKGGVGKTTSAANVAACLARTGKRTLAVDADPQGSLTLALGTDPMEVPVTIGDAMLSGVPLPELATSLPNLTLVPANRSLADAEFLLSAKMGRERFLSRALATVGDRYDVAVVDTPPSLGLLTVNTLTAAHILFVPVAPALLSQAGLRDLLTTVEEVKAGINPNLRLGGVFLTFAEARTVAARRAEADLREELGETVLTTTITRRIAHEYAAQAGVPVVAWEPNGTAATEYQQLTQEIWNRVQQTNPG